MKNHALFLSLAFFMAAGCGSDNNSSTPTASGTSPVTVSEVREVDCALFPANVTVNVQNHTFSPGTETIQRDQVVMWNNMDSDAHTVTAGLPNAPTGKFDIALPANQKKCAIFTKADTYNYFCRIHPSMTAKIVVEAPPEE